MRSKSVIDDPIVGWVTLMKDGKKLVTSRVKQRSARGVCMLSSGRGV